ncbi:MAG TPA: acyl-CoA dehydrogenase family protein, partial [Solirubrobacteraceae bacterium]|nr:acyl-CoA dehydrogenase family protein [Solirubrobacteraceae bacterium]
EPDAGSDPLTMRMRARRERGEWVLNGAENWIANAGVADLYVVFAESRRATDRIAVFAVPGDAPGLTISRLEHKMGMRGSPSGDVRLPDEYVVSAPRRGIHDRHAHARSLAPRDRRPSARHRAGGDRLRGVPRPGKDHEIQRVVIARALWSLTAVRRAGRD